MLVLFLELEQIPVFISVKVYKTFIFFMYFSLLPWKFIVLNFKEVIDNYRWTDKGFKRWPLGVSNLETKLLCFHCPMKMARTAMCTALMRHEFKHTTASPDLRVVHYMPTREFREFIVISNAAKQVCFHVYN